jgi:hypothetical protein
VITVFGHGLVQRADVPIPAVAFAWSAAAVLVISFVALAALWPKPRLETVECKPLPGGRVLGSAWVSAVCGAVGVFLLAVVVWAGLAGEQGPQDNFAPTFVYVIVWVGLVFASLLFGDVFRAFNPWLAVGRWLRWEGRAPYPARLGRWPAAAGLLFFTWTELVGRWGDTPDRIAIGTLIYSGLTWAAMWRYGAETWASRGEAFAVYFGFFARISMFESRDGVVGRRPLLGGLPRLDPLPGTVAVVCVMIGTVTFDGLSQGAAWTENLGVWLFDFFDALGFGDDMATDLAGTVGLLGGVALVAGFYRLGINGAASVGGGFTPRRLQHAFVHSLVPIAAVYAMAHYFSSLIYQGQKVSYLASDPLGHGWDLFGTAGSGVSPNVLSQNAIWYCQIAFVVLGHVGALILAHDRALSLYTDAREAVRSQYWMLSIMVGFTSLALWLLSQANA